MCRAANDLDYTNDFLNIINIACLPSALIFLFNTLSLKRIISIGNRVGRRRSKNFIGSVISMNFVFLLVYLPWSVVFLIHHTVNYEMNDPNSLNVSSFVNSFSFQMVYSITDCVSYLNNLVPFFFNFAFNSIFRKCLFQMLSSHKDQVSE